MDAELEYHDPAWLARRGTIGAVLWELTDVGAGGGMVGQVGAVEAFDVQRSLESDG